ncbi:MAG: elongation factor P [Phycisphaerales bacterium]
MKAATTGTNPLKARKHPESRAYEGCVKEPAGALPVHSIATTLAVMPIKASDVRRGQALRYEGALQVVIDTEHVKPGKGPAYVQAKMKNIETGTIKVNRLNSFDKLEDVSIDKRKMQYLYDSSGHGSGPYVFMDQENFEQLEVDGELLGTDSQWLKEGVEVTVMMIDGRSLGVELPAAVELMVTDTTPQVKGATATNQLKEATVETGGKIRVPPFIENGQTVKINTETGEYLGKA